MNEYLVTYVNEAGIECEITLFASHEDECLAHLADIYPYARVMSTIQVKNNVKVN